MLIKVEPITDDYWNTFFILPESQEDVFNLCTHKEIRDIIENQPSNLSKLVQKAIARIQVFVDEVKQPTQDEMKQILNCIRLLTRVMPVIFELDTDDFELDLFWSSDKLGVHLIQQITKLLFYRGYYLIDKDLLYHYLLTILPMYSISFGTKE